MSFGSLVVAALAAGVALAAWTATAHEGATVPCLGGQGGLRCPSAHVVLAARWAPAFLSFGGVAVALGFVWRENETRIGWVTGAWTTSLAAFGGAVFPTTPPPSPAWVIFIVGWTVALAPALWRPRWGGVGLIGLGVLVVGAALGAVAATA